ncbi:heavy-metal-associated domain-containing protein [Wenyingzhuangia sp. IMCC45533]
MKFIQFILIAFLSISFVGCKQSSEKKETVEALPAKLLTANINIDGMTCEIGCAKTIESKISKMEGVQESKVNFKDKEGVFVYDANKTSEEKLMATINNLLDGKTYTATKSAKLCEPDCKKACCTTKTKIKDCKPDCEKPCCTAKKGDS